MTAPVNRIGIVAKHGLLAASEHLARLGAWLRERRIDAVYETGSAALAGSPPYGSPPSPEELPTAVDLIIVPAGSGPLLALADPIAAAGGAIPLPGANFATLA